MPRRKYGRLQKSVTTNDPHKCRLCKLGKPCPAHPNGIPKTFVTGKKFKKRVATREDFLQGASGGSNSSDASDGQASSK